MEMIERRLGEHGIWNESLLLFLSPSQSGVMFRAKGEGHGWLLLSLLFSSSSSIIKLLYKI